MQDSDILALFYERNEDAIRKTDQKYRALCLSVAKNILGSEDDARECVNDALLALWNAIPPMQPQSLCAYLCGVTRNLAMKRLEYLSAAKRSQALTVSLSDLEEMLGSEVVEQYSSTELARLLSAFLRTEHPDARRVFLRRYYFLDSISTIAKRYLYSESKVKSMLFQTRRRLRHFLQDEGIEL